MLRPNSRISGSNTTHHMLPSQETVCQNFQRLVKSQKKLFTACCLSFVFVLLFTVGCIAITVYFAHWGCATYSTVNKIYSGNTLLVSPNIDTSCHDELFLDEFAGVTSFIDQEVQIFTGRCEDVYKYRDHIYSPRYGYTNLTNSFGIYDNGFLSVNSNISVAINVSVPLNSNSKVIVCLFNNESSFIEFSTNQAKWRDYIQYAVFCNSAVVSTSEPTMMTVFNFNVKTEDYYSLGFASYDLISYLDEVVYGERFLYNTTNFTRINCTLYTQSTPACRLPLSSTGTSSCWLIYAVPPIEVSKGFSGIQLSSNIVMSSKLYGVTVVLPAVLAVIAFLLLVVLLCVWLRKVRRALSKKAVGIM